VGPKISSAWGLGFRSAKAEEPQNLQTFASSPQKSFRLRSSRFITIPSASSPSIAVSSPNLHARLMM